MWDKNYYYHPTEQGLTSIGEVDGGGSYEFEIVAVWQRNDDKTLVWASDGGCSCPTPFDGVELRPFDGDYAFEEFVKALDSCRADTTACRALEETVRYMLKYQKTKRLDVITVSLTRADIQYIQKLCKEDRGDFTWDNSQWNVRQRHNELVEEALNSALNQEEN